MAISEKPKCIYISTSCNTFGCDFATYKVVHSEEAAETHIRGIQDHANGPECEPCEIELVVERTHIVTPDE